VKKLFVCLVVALLAGGCNSEDGGGGSPTDPSQVNIEFSTTDLVVGTGAEAVVSSQATTNFELWLYNAAGTASKGTRIQGSDTAGPLTIVMGTGRIVPSGQQVIPGFEQGIRGMRVGGKRRIYIPPSLAWGPAGIQQIPPNASVVFEVELTNVVGP
jgi:FKBP-type peptidyl-prolyl cis-trans isomerase FkpA